MEAWTYDSKGFTNTELKRLDYVSNSEIKAYLDSSSHNKLFLVGPKGCGKTLLLHKKAYEYFEAQKKNDDESGAKNISDGLVENISFTSVRLSDSTLLELKDYDKWKDIWIFAIGLTTLIRSGEELPERLLDVVQEFEDFDAIRYIVPEILNNYEEYRRLRLFADYNNLIMSRVRKLQNRYVLFIDGLDGALDVLLTSSDYDRVKEGDPYLVYTIWRAAQTGLLYACFDLPTSHNRRLVVYATAREEALSIDSQMAINLKSYCAYLRYTDDQLREIFRKNVRHTPKGNLYTHKSKHVEAGMLGFERIAHIVAKELNGPPKVEESIDLLLRHTFRRPREIVLLGKNIFTEFNANLNGQNRNEAPNDLKEATRNLVNKSAYNDIFASYVKEIFPSFRHEYLEQFMEQVDSNVLTRERILEFDPEMINYLYRVGLIGYVESNNKQKFAPPLTYISAEEKVVPWSKFYVVHPVLDSKFQEKHDVKKFYSPYNIIGHGNDFTPPPIGLESLFLEHPVDFFKPKDISGKGQVKEKWNSARIFVDSDKLYGLLFKKEENIIIRQELQSHLEDAGKLFKYLLSYWAIGKLELAYGNDNLDLQQKKSEVLRSIFSLFRKAAYEARIDNLTEESQRKFIARLFGRISVVGMLTAMDYDIPRAANLIKTFAPNQEDTTESGAYDVAHLRRGFFIAHLPEKDSLDQEKLKKIWSCLSPFESYLLQEWYENYTKEILFSAGNFSEVQKDYLKQRVKEMVFYKFFLKKQFL